MTETVLYLKTVLSESDSGAFKLAERYNKKEISERERKREGDFAKRM